MVLPWVADCTASQVCVDADRSGNDCSGFDAATDGEAECTALSCDHFAPATAGMDWTVADSSGGVQDVVDWADGVSNEIQVFCSLQSVLPPPPPSDATCVCRACGASAR